MASKKNKQIVRQEILAYIKALKKNNIDVTAAYLFGSYVNNRADEWSDIDVAILTDSYIGDSFDFKYLLMKIARDIDPDLEPHPCLTTEFNNSNPFAAQILRTGEKVF